MRLMRLPCLLDRAVALGAADPTVAARKESEHTEHFSLRQRVGCVLGVAVGLLAQILPSHRRSHRQIPVQPPAEQCLVVLRLQA